MTLTTCLQTSGKWIGAVKGFHPNQTCWVSNDDNDISFVPFGIRVSCPNKLIFNSEEEVVAQFKKIVLLIKERQRIKEECKKSGHTYNEEGEVI